MNELRLQQDLRQTLETLLTPRLMQMLRVLNLPYHQLVEDIAQQAEENVLLEVERRDEFAEFLRYLTSDRKIKKEADFSELPGLENIGSITKTLEEHLLNQLELEELDETTERIVKMIIENIEDTGYVLAYPRLRERIMAELGVSRPTVDKALKIVQSFEPEGVGARDLKECLLIQIAAYNFENEELQEIIGRAVAGHLDEIAAGEYAKAAAELNVPESGVAQIAAFIKNNLNPHPASAFGGEVSHVIPSFAIEIGDKNDFRLVNLERGYGPRVNISAHYLKMLDDPKTDPATKEFLKEKLKAAKNLIEDLAKRSETLEKIVRKIVGSQEDFLRKGAGWLRPLSQRSLADEFGYHPSTISRTVAEKYIQTPQGLFPLKFLCPRGPKGLTVGRIKALLAGLIREEDKNKPLSDSELTALMTEKGASIDRRTVAYYRKELKIPTAQERQPKEKR